MKHVAFTNITSPVKQVYILLDIKSDIKNGQTPSVTQCQRPSYTLPAVCKTSACEVHFSLNIITQQETF